MTKTFFLSRMAGGWLTGLLMLTSFLAQAQAPGWGPVQTHTTQLSAGLTFPNGTYVAGTAVDAAGNVFVAGSFSSTVVFGSTTLVAVGGGSNTFVTKWSPATNSFVWALQTSSTDTNGNDFAFCIAVSGSSVYVGGQTFAGNTSFGSTVLTNPGAPGTTSSAYVAKLTDAGNSAAWTWTQAARAVGYATFSGLAVSGANVYASGYYSGPLVLGAVTLSNSGSNSTMDLVVTKLTDAGSSGAFVWAERGGGRGGDRAVAVAVSGPYVYITGFTNYDATFGPITIGSSTVRTNLPYLARLFDNGPSATYTWVTPIASTATEPTALVVRDGGDLFVAAQYTGRFTSGSTTLSNAGGSHSIIGKFSDNGSAAVPVWWVGGGAATANDSPLALAVRGANVYVGGFFNGASATFGSTTLTNAGAANRSDIYLAKLTDAGSSAAFSWAQQAGGSGYDAATALALGPDRVYVAGQATPPATFGSQTITGTYAASTAYFTTATDAALALLPTLNAFAPGSGAVGSTVTLTGTNLTGTTGLTLSGQPISGFTVNAAGTTLTFVIPAGSVAGSFAVTTPTGTATAPGSFCVPYTPTTPGGSRCGTGAILVTVGGAPSAGSYVWYATATGTTPIAGVTSTSYTPNLSATTTYYVSVSTGQGAAGCEGPRTPVVATIHPVAPRPQVTQATQPNGTVLLTSNVGAGNQWYLNGVAIAGATAATYLVGSPALNGTYTAVVTATTGCVSIPSSPQTVTVVLGTAPAALAAQVQVYPNPTTGRFTLTLPAARAAQVQVLNALGQLVQARSTTGNAALDLNGLARGVYAVRVQLGADVVTKRIILE